MQLGNPNLGARLARYGRRFSLSANVQQESEELDLQYLDSLGEKAKGIWPLGTRTWTVTVATSPPAQRPVPQDPAETLRAPLELLASIGTGAAGAFAAVPIPAYGAVKLFVGDSVRLRVRSVPYVAGLVVEQPWTGVLTVTRGRPIEEKQPGAQAAFQASPNTLIPLGAQQLYVSGDDSQADVEYLDAAGNAIGGVISIQTAFPIPRVLYPGASFVRVSPSGQGFISSWFEVIR